MTKSTIWKSWISLKMGSSWNCLKITKLYTHNTKTFCENKTDPVTVSSFSKMGWSWNCKKKKKKKKKKTQATHVKRNSNSIQDMAHAYLIPFTFSGWALFTRRGGNVWRIKILVRAILSYRWLVSQSLLP